MIRLRKRTCLALVLLLLIAGQRAHAQFTTAIDAINVKGDAGGVEMIWKIKAGNTCNGIQILRSLDSISFSTIGTIEGVCGSLEEAQVYTFTDLQPVPNRINYYRILLNDLGYSHTVSLPVIAVQANGYLLFPHPASNFMNLYFSNATLREQTLYIYNVQGQPVATTTTSAEQINLHVSQYPAGLYTFRLLPLNLSGKFYILH